MCKGMNQRPRRVSGVCLPRPLPLWPWGGSGRRRRGWYRRWHMRWIGHDVVGFLVPAEQK